MAGPDSQNINAAMAAPPGLDIRQQIHHDFTSLGNHVTSVLSQNEELRANNAHLNRDLEVYKDGWTRIKSEKENLESIKREVERQLQHALEQLKGHRVVALLDGDGAIFDPSLVAQGQKGGHDAAKTLHESVHSYLNDNYGPQPYKLWVYIFFNKRGLVDTFGRFKFVSAKANFNEFAMGFNQAAESFLMVDVGNLKEAADAKIKAFLDDEIRNPQTCRVLFGGCHDSGYANALRAQITAGYKDKLTLVKTYNDMADAIVQLGLPQMNTPSGLFIPQKLGGPSELLKRRLSVDVPSRAQQRRASFIDPLPFSPIQDSDDPNTSKGSIPNGTVAKASVAPLAQPLADSPTPTSQSFAAVAATTKTTAVIAKRAPTPDLDSSSDTCTETSLESEAFSTIQKSSKGRPIKEGLPLSKQKPPPCTLFYLTEHCKHGENCIYGHDYVLNADHYDEMRKNAKKGPCPMINQGSACTWAEKCCYGHVCPQGLKCHFLKSGNCKFKGADMHKEVMGR